MARDCPLLPRVPQQQTQSQPRVQQQQQQAPVQQRQQTGGSGGSRGRGRVTHLTRADAEVGRRRLPFQTPVSSPWLHGLQPKET
ncbi:hypothetical protein Taro_035501 [Colocasia esculenta]|uniref:Uncharacterized protein n=1 Tax=Colocasia esculenta TaxID=4460 RepID=A0A843W6U8_COLES|nr:hypothetical protein [Colocasia esculenta]